jgi:hypothetical protein
MAACWSGRHSRFQREHLKAALNSAAYMSEGKDPSRIVPCRTKGESGDRIIWRSGHQIIGVWPGTSSGSSFLVFQGFAV